MSTYEESAVQALSITSNSIPVALRGIGWALLALAEALRQPAVVAEEEKPQ